MLVGTLTAQLVTKRETSMYADAQTRKAAVLNYKNPEALAGLTEGHEVILRKLRRFNRELDLDPATLLPRAVLVHESPEQIRRFEKELQNARNILIRYGAGRVRLL